MNANYRRIAACVALACVLLFAGCNNTAQTTLGHDYFPKYESAPSGVGFETDDEVRRIADVAPILAFPAWISV